MFKKVADGSTIPSGKAYLSVPNGIVSALSSGVKGFSFVFEDEDDPDGIQTLSNSSLNGENIYNIAGQRLNRMQKGINIVNGNKVLY